MGAARTEVNQLTPLGVRRVGEALDRRNWMTVSDCGMTMLKWSPPPGWDPWDELPAKDRWRYAYQAARTCVSFSAGYYTPRMRPLFLTAQTCLSAREGS